MQVLERKYARDLYIPELQLLYDYGEPVKVGNRETLEIINFASVVTEPWHHCILLPSRRWNPWLALSEGLWILAGRNDLAPLVRFNSNIVMFSDDDKTLYGAYGKRLYNQMEDLIGRLRKDPADRRAVLSIWTADDLTAQTKDPPCNDMVMFKLRENKLHMTVINRSNDIHWGLFAVNLPTFSLLQVYIAARLGCEIGNQTHMSNSLHVYVDWPEPKRITERMLFDEKEDKPIYPNHSLAFIPNEMKGMVHFKSSLSTSDIRFNSAIKYKLVFEIKFYQSQYLCGSGNTQYLDKCPLRLNIAFRSPCYRVSLIIG